MLQFSAKALRQFYLYDIADNLIGFLNDPLTGVQMSPVDDISRLDYESGAFRFEYHFVHSIIPFEDSKIVDISPDRLEILVKTRNSDAIWLMYKLANGMFAEFDAPAFKISTHDGRFHRIVAQEFIENPHTEGSVIRKLAFKPTKFQYRDAIITPDDKSIQVIRDSVYGLPYYKELTIPPQIIPSRMNVVRIKLLEPLPASVDLNASCEIIREVIDPVIDELVIYSQELTEYCKQLRGPNFNITTQRDLRETTSYKSYSDLSYSGSRKSEFNAVTSASSQTFRNVNYSKFGNFVRFSSAVNRLEVFYDKISKIEMYESDLDALQSVTGTHASIDRGRLSQLKDKTISTFDGYEKWLYFTSGSFESGSLPPWPKNTSTKPYTLRNTSGSVVYYAGMLASASLYDYQNPHKLTRTTPELVESSEYARFVSMVGHFFDDLYLKIATIGASVELDDSESMPISMLKRIAADMGLNLEMPGSTLQEYFLGVGDVPVSDYIQEVWKRLVIDWPHISKTAGTISAIKSLLNIYGIPETGLFITEYGKTQRSSAIQKIPREIYNHRVDLQSFAKMRWGTEYRPTIEIRMLPSQSVNRWLVSSNGNYVNISRNGATTGSFEYVTSTTSSIMRVDRMFDGNPVHFAMQESVNGGSSSITFQVIKTRKNSDQIIEHRSWVMPPVPSPAAPTWREFSGGFKLYDIREYSVFLEPEVIRTHASSPTTYHSNETSGSYYDMGFRFKPNRYTATLSQTTLTASARLRLSGQRNSSNYVTFIGGYNYSGDAETVYVPAYQSSNSPINGVEIVTSSLSTNKLSSTRSVLNEQSRKVTPSFLLGAYWSPNAQTDLDIYNHTGIFSIEDYDDTKLDRLRREYFKKYQGRMNINQFIAQAAKYDTTLFTLIGKLIPAKIKLRMGVLIEPTILERPRVKVGARVSKTRYDYSTTLTKRISNNITATKVDHETSIRLPDVAISAGVPLQNVGINREFASIQRNSFVPAIYRFYNSENSASRAGATLVANDVLRSNGYWRYQGKQTVLDVSRPSATRYEKVDFNGQNEYFASSGSFESYSGSNMRFPYSNNSTARVLSGSTWFAATWPSPSTKLTQSYTSRVDFVRKYNPEIKIDMNSSGFPIIGATSASKVGKFRVDVYRSSSFVDKLGGSTALRLSYDYLLNGTSLYLSMSHNLPVFNKFGNKSKYYFQFFNGARYIAPGTIVKAPPCIYAFQHWDYINGGEILRFRNPTGMLTLTSSYVGSRPQRQIEESGVFMGQVNPRFALYTQLPPQHTSFAASASLLIDYMQMRLYRNVEAQDYESRGASNHRYKGSKLRSDSITSDSTDPIPGGGPVIEVRTVNPATLIFDVNSLKGLKIAQSDTILGNFNSTAPPS